VKNVVDRLADAQGSEIIQLQGMEENITFALPRELQV